MVLGPARGRLPEKVLAKHRLLAVVGGAGLLAVEHVWLLCHALEREPADGLAMLDHEGYVARSHLERGTAAVGAVAPRRVAEAGVEEPRIVRAQLAGGGIVGEHLRCIGGRGAAPRGGE